MFTEERAMAKREFKVGDVVRYKYAIFNGVGVGRGVKQNRYFVDCVTMRPQKGHIARGYFGDKYK